MRMSAFVLSTAMAAAVPGAAMAQTTASASTAVAGQVAPAVSAGPTVSHWVMSGFVGSNFGAATTNPSVDFGGQLAYLWKGIVGVEGLADFSPNLKIDNAALSEFPEANAYMGNAIFAIPLGDEGQFHPYVSGGWGGIQLRTSVFNAALPHPSGTFPTGTTGADEVHGGADVGAGIMGFAGRIGFRGDVRYFKAQTNNNISTTATPASQFTQTVLSGLDFWRANIGIAVRW